MPWRAHLAQARRLHVKQSPLVVVVVVLVLRACRLWLLLLLLRLRRRLTGNLLGRRRPQALPPHAQRQAVRALGRPQRLRTITTTTTRITASSRRRPPRSGPCVRAGRTGAEMQIAQRMDEQ